MFNREELMSKDISELVEIARSFNIEPETIGSTEEAIDQILALQENAEKQEPAKRTRKRVIKKDTTDHVYSVNGIDGENLDTKAAKRKAKASTEIFSTPLSDDAASPFPKHRGRKSKAEIEYLASLAEAERKRQEETEMQESEMRESAETTSQTDTAEMPVPENGAVVDGEAHLQTEAIADETQSSTDSPSSDNDAANRQDSNETAYVPEAAFGPSEEDRDETSANLIAQLQAKMNAQNEGAYYENYQPAGMDTYDEHYFWEGDPGDGTDFIIVEDLPIEDAGATMSVDIFDNPVNTSIIDSYTQQENEESAPAYSFENIVKTIGLVEIMPENYGFLRSSDYNYLSSPDDVFVPMPIIRKYGLKTGDVIECTVCPPTTGEKYFTIQNIERINGRDPQDIRDRIPFEHLTPLFPDEKFNLCGNPSTTNLSTRIVDLFAPIGKGQRALIVAQPKTGKTILMKDIANAIAASHPEAYLMMLLIDERPEEVTDMARTVNAEVIASTFDEPAERHVKIAGLVLEKAKRMVECGHDVVIFLDSITRLARAYNTVAPASGKVLTGGVDANALQKPKRFFGAARNIEGGGSLTIISTALIDTGSKMDEVIFEEFKGTGNMELQLERSLSNKRIFPAVNLVQSSTRRDDLLQEKTVLDRMWIVRKFISDMNPVEAMNEIHSRLERTRDNEEFLLSINN